MTRLRGVAGPLGLWLLAVSAVGIVVARGQDQERDGLVERFQNRADTGAGFVSAYAQDVFKTEGRLAAQVSRPDADPADFAATAKLLGFPAAVMLDHEGRAVALAPSAPEMEGVDLAEKYAHLRGALAGKPTVSDVVPSAVAGDPIVAFALPVASDRIAVLSGAFNISNGPLALFLKGQPIAGTHAVLLDSHGQVIASADNENALSQAQLSTLQESPKPVLTDGRVLAASPVEGTGWTYVIDAPRTALFAPATSNNLGEWLLLAGAALLTLCGLVVARRSNAARAQALLEKSQIDQRLRLTVQNAPVGMTVVDMDGRLVEPNRRLCRMLGYSPTELPELTFDDVTHADDQHLDRELMAQLSAGEIDTYEVEKRYVRNDGSLLWGRLSVSVVRDASGAPSYFVSQIEDVTEVRRARRDLQQRALYDPLTGLANRSLLMDRLTMALANDRHRVNVGVAFCDLDHFKVINDTHGHHVGDEVLKAVASRLQATVRTEDTVARLGGDEFVILLHDAVSPDEARAVMERARQAVQEPIVVDGVTVRTSISGGLAIASVGGDPEVLLRDADAALYVAKNAGRGRIEVHGSPHGVPRGQTPSVLGALLRTGRYPL